MVHEGVKAAAELLALRSVDSLIEGAAVWLFASLILRLTPRQNAASRFAVWFCALLAIASMPVFSAVWSPAVGFASSGSKEAVIRLPESAALCFLGCWAIVSLALMVQVARSLWRLHMLRRSCIPIDPATLDPLVQRTLRKYGVKRRATICTSEQVRVPAALGLWRPTVVLPQWAMKELSGDELNHVVLHELAHLQRWDDWTNLAQQVLKALLFFHPAVWWIERKAVLEREIACDDAVLAETSRPRDYAECLARLAEKSLVHRSLAMAQAALGRVRQMSTRVARILDANRANPTSVVWRPAALLVAVFAIGCGIWFSKIPRLLAFEDHLSPASAATMASARVPELKPAEFKQAPASPTQVTDLKFTETRHHQSNLSQRPTRVLAKSTESRQNLIHLTKAQASPLPVTETMWIVVESGGSVANHPLMQIEMWRVTILHVAAGDSTPRIPRKI